MIAKNVVLDDESGVRTGLFTLNKLSVYDFKVEIGVDPDPKAKSLDWIAKGSSTNLRTTLIVNPKLKFDNQVAVLAKKYTHVTDIPEADRIFSFIVKVQVNDNDEFLTEDDEVYNRFQHKVTDLKMIGDPFWLLHSRGDALELTGTASQTTSMRAIINNPYRILGVLAGAGNREIIRQANSLKKHIEAGVEPPVDFSFAYVDNFQRTVEDIDDAIERNDTDSEKIGNALFWFWKGYDITDEPAFDALKEGDIQAALGIWHQLIIGTKEDGNRFWREVTEKNASAYHNFFVASYLTNGNTDAHAAITEQIFFLESDYWRNFKTAVTDITYSSSKKALQLLFLNTLISEKAVETSILVKIIEPVDFVAKADFLKSISKTFSEKVTAQIDIAEKKRNESKANAADAGENLHRQTQADLKQLKEIWGEQDFLYSNMADKVAKELLQCSIDYFNDSQEKERDNDYHKVAEELAIIAQSIAVGSVAKERISESLRTLEEMKDKEIKQIIALLQSVKDAYETNVREIDAQVSKQSKSLGWGQSINWSRVEELKRNSINWDKVNELLRDALSDKNIEKIKNCTDATKKKKFVELAEWINNHSTSKYVIKAALDKYYGRTVNIRPVSATTPTSTYRPTNTPEKEDDSAAVIFWIMIISIIVSAILLNIFS
jgi:hypothetical protein